MTIPIPTILAILTGITVALTPFSFGGENPIGRFALFLCAGFALLLTLRDGLRSIRATWWKNPDAWFLFFLFLCGISFFVTPSLLLSRETFAIILLWWMFFVIGRTFRTEHNRVFLVIYLLFGTLAVAVWSLIIHFDYPGTIARTFGPYRNSDGLGPSLLLTFFLSWALTLMVQPMWRRVLLFCCAFVITVTLVLTSAVSAGIGIFGAGLFGLFFFRPRFRIRPIGSAILLLLLIAGSIYAFRTAQNKQTGSEKNPIATLEDFTGVGALSSFRERVGFIRASLAMASDRPLTGQGLGLWRAVLPKFQQNLTVSGTAHGELPHRLGELGWPGVVALSGLLLSTVFLALQTARKSGSVILSSAALGLGALAIAGSIDVPWFYPSITAMFWLVAGMAVAPATHEIPRLGWARIVPLVVALTAIGSILFGTLRFMTSRLVSQAEKSGNQGDWIDAYSTAGLALRLLPNHEEEMRLMRLLNFNARLPSEQQEARRATERVLRNNPLQPAAYLQLGIIERNTGNFTAAESFFRDGLAVDPHFAPYLSIELARLLIAQDRVAEGKEIVVLARSQTGRNIPNVDQAMSDLAETTAVAELILGERDEAKQHLEEALRLDPNNADAKTIYEKEFP